MRRMSLLEDKNEVYIKGASGVGKTSLVMKVAQEVFCRNDSEYDSVLFYSAKKQRIVGDSIEQIPNDQPHFFKTLEQLSLKIFKCCDLWIPTVPQIKQQEKLKEFLIASNLKFLIIIDNFETLDLQERSKIWLFFKDLNKPESIKVVYTGRETPYDMIIVEPLLEHEALEMVEYKFSTISKLEAKDIISGCESRSLIDICGRIPLAIEWAFALLSKGVPSSKFIASIEGGVNDLLKYMFEDLINLLREKDQLALGLLQALSVTSYPLGKDAIRFIMGLGQNESEKLDRSIKFLVDYSFCNVVNTGLYSLKALVRNYSLGLLRADSETYARINHRWVGYFLEFSQQNGGDDWGSYRDKYNRLDRYWENIQEVFRYLQSDWASDDPFSYETSKKLWGYLQRFTYLNAYWATREKWTDELILEAQVRNDTLFLARLLSANGWIYVLREGKRNYISASENFNKALECLASEPDNTSMDIVEAKWVVLLNYAATNVRRKRFNLAISSFYKFLMLWRFALAPSKRVVCMLNRSCNRNILRYYLYRGEYFYRLSISLSENQRNNSANLHRPYISPDRALLRAERYYQIVADGSKLIHWDRFQAKAMERISYLMIFTNRTEEAAIIIARWKTKSREYGDKRRLAFFLRNEALLHQIRTDYAMCKDSAELALKAFRELGMDERALEMNSLIIQAGDKRLSTVSKIKTLNQIRVSFLVLATEWQSGHGGLSTLNRLFCYALARAGAEVVCLVLDVSESDKQSAQDCGVTILKASGIPGSKDTTALLSRKHPTLPQDFAPRYIVGHGRITGPAALAQQDHFPSAHRIHFIHMAPDEIDWHKHTREDDAGKRADERTNTEVELGRTANRIITVGPRLHDRFQTDFSPFDIYPLIRLDPGFDHYHDENRDPPPGRPFRVLVFGRIDDWDLKGLDIAATAMGIVTERRGHDLSALELVIRGAPEGTSEEIRQKVQKHAGKSLQVVVREYSPNAQTLEHDILRASLVLMPSRSEGFGLVGLEAIVAGTPILLSDQSGIAALLKEALNAEQVNQFVVRMNGENVIEDWSRAIEAVLRDRNAAFLNAAMLRKDLLEKEKTWDAAIGKLLRELDHL